MRNLRLVIILLCLAAANAASRQDDTERNKEALDASVLFPYRGLELLLTVATVAGLGILAVAGLCELQQSRLRCIKYHRNSSAPDFEAVQRLNG
mmetsp:Transcript_42690/g.107767  ORF Transcript_42690/g.107767 Transcript_42690/m.107767 type:complete len:94 (-) Transcript_42690:327-608(-)